MTKPNITIVDAGKENATRFRLVKFEIPGGVTSPIEFFEAVQEIEGKLSGDLPVLINGRGPVWGYGMLIHEAHPSPAIATFDPRIGYVVVATHDSRFRIGQIIQDPEA